jgi:AcrR family transcriptional regulator
MNQSSANGRDRILDAAERLMAARGIRGVSLREINAAAAQRNASGVQYHFGNRAGLVAAVIQRHMQRADAARNTLIDTLEAHGRTAPADVFAAIVAPLADALVTASGRAYLQLLDQMMDRPEIAALDVGSGLNRSLDRAGRLLAGALRHLPAALRAPRRQLCTAFLLRSLADRARAIESATAQPDLNQDAFIANLVDVLVAVLTAPASDATRRAVRSVRRARAARHR